MIGSVLVANRGEIAVRLIRAYRGLGVRTIAVYSDADAAALHVRLADEALPIGPAPVTASYLNQEAVIGAARAAGAAAVDPGYGLLPAALAAAAGEAQSAFGRPGVYLERDVPDARHVEVQVLADDHGTVLCLGDRDCSVQRRHQKLIEEAPAPFLPDKVRTAMHEAAIRLAAEAGYRSAGTVEFLYSPAGGEFFFLEMNTRLQVEHGVTELVTGLDLVELRLAVASGAPLGLTQDDVRIRGHAIEARVASEDPWRQFLPVPGTVTGLHIPSGPWLRADFGVAAGDQVPAEYDSLFGKLMAWGPDRETARRRLAAALGELRVSGPPSTAPYLRDILTRPEFAAGTYSTTTLEQRWPPQPDQRSAADQGQDQAWPGSGSPGTTPATARTVQVRTSAGPFRIVIHGRPVTGASAGRAGRGAGPRPGPRPPAAAGQPAAPMDGVVVKVGAACGDEVERHAVLVVLEAMKMQIPVTAPWPGRVTALLVAEGDSVTAGQPLAEVSRPPEPGAS